MTVIMDRLNDYAGVIVIALALVTGGAYVVNQHHEQEQTKKLNDHITCLAQYNTAFAAQSTIRSAINQESDDAKTDFLKGLSAALQEKPTTDPKVKAARAAAGLKILHDFDTATQRVADERAATPLPTLPSC